MKGGHWRWSAIGGLLMDQERRQRFWLAIFGFYGLKPTMKNLPKLMATMEADARVALRLPGGRPAGSTNGPAHFEVFKAVNALRKKDPKLSIAQACRELAKKQRFKGQSPNSLRMRYQTYQRDAVGQLLGN